MLKADRFCDRVGRNRYDRLTRIQVHRERLFFGLTPASEPSPAHRTCKSITACGKACRIRLAVTSPLLPFHQVPALITTLGCFFPASVNTPPYVSCSVYYF